MQVTEFRVEILEEEVVVHHIKQGHTYRFRIVGKDTVGFRGAIVEPNPKAKREARGYLLEARNAACAAFK